MTQRRSRLLIMSVLGTALVASGCVLSTTPKVGTGQTETTNVSGGMTGTNGSSANVAGTVKVPSAQLSADGKSPAKYALAAVSNYKGVVAAEVTLRDHLGAKITNAPSAKTDGNGKYALNKVPPEQSCFLTADYGGVRLANLVTTANKKTVTCNLTLGTTLACAALAPMLTYDEKNNKNPASAADIDPKLFESLIASVEAVLTDATAIKPRASLKDMYVDFTPLLNNADVKKAYDALLADFKAKGKTINPNPTGKPTTTDPTNPDKTSTDTTKPASSATTVVDPTQPAKTYDPVKGTLERIDSTTVSGSGAAQLIKMTVPLIGDVLALLDGDKLWAINETTLKSVPSSQLGQAFTEAYALATDGTKHYTVGKVDDVLSVITLSPGAMGFTATTKALTGDAVGKVTGLVWSSEKSALIAADYSKHDLVTIKPDTGEVTLYAGKPGDPTGEDLSTGTLTDMRFNNPASLVKDGSKLYVADFNRNRVVKIDLSTNKGKLLAGGEDAGHTGLTNGTLAAAKFQKPIGLWLASNGGMLIADQNNHAMRQLKDSDDEVRSFVSTSKGDAATGQNLVSFPRAIAEFNSKIIVITSANEVYKFTRNP